jgi:hypothetical protein
MKIKMSTIKQMVIEELDRSSRPRSVPKKARQIVVDGQPFWWLRGKRGFNTVIWNAKGERHVEDTFRNDPYDQRDYRADDYDDIDPAAGLSPGHIADYIKGFLATGEDWSSTKDFTWQRQHDKNIPKK